MPPSETEYSCKYGSTPKLTLHNYFAWRPQLEAFLGSEEALGIVLGTEARPAAAQRVAQRDYDLRSAKAYTLLFSACSPIVKAQISDIHDPAAIWLRLQQKLDTAYTRAGRSAISLQFDNLRPTEDADIGIFITGLLECQSQLAGTDKAITDETILTKLTNKAPKRFHLVLDIIARQPIEIQTLQYLMDGLIQYEKELRNRRQKHGVDIDDPSPPTKALAATSTQAKAAVFSTPKPPFRGRGGFRGGFRGRGGASSSSSRPTCWYCRKVGHRENDCRKKQFDVRNRRGNASGSGGFSRGNGGFGGRNGSFGGNSGNGGFAGNGSGGYGSSGFSAGGNGRVEAGFVQALAALGSAEEREYQWIIDSGASKHLCADIRQFTSLYALGSDIQVLTADNSILLAKQAGHIRLKLSSGAHIDIEALYTPNLHYSLLSVACLSEIYDISFSSKRCFLGNTQIGRQNGGIYVLDILPQHFSALPSPNIYGALATPLPNIELWHQHLAHLGTQALKSLLLPNQYIDTGAESRDCVVCIKAKHQRKVLRKPIPRTTRPFELIHSDLCRPITPLSAIGARYFILYIDDYSRASFLHYLYSKTSSEVTAVFQAFRERMENQFPQYRIS